eukprot:TRINITY_DN6930_c0_g1_i4.p5 TRINITY_DN6930_c0_g1~~TRINITY_DN6930_c0_g1_i4.p5  ORF type:complete len:234 (-),score=15.94 TRINITY_DN6930_c0_g1_i4:10-711(-)
MLVDPRLPASIIVAVVVIAGRVVVVSVCRFPQPPVGVIDIAICLAIEEARCTTIHQTVAGHTFLRQAAERTPASFALAVRDTAPRFTSRAAAHAVCSAFGILPQPTGWAAALLAAIVTSPRRAARAGGRDREESSAALRLSQFGARRLSRDAARRTYTFSAAVVGQECFSWLAQSVSVDSRPLRPVGNHRKKLLVGGGSRQQRQQEDDDSVRHGATARIPKTKTKRSHYQKTY